LSNSAQQRVTLLLTVGGSFEPSQAQAKIARQDVRHD
jgi:hypothetical protein